MSVRIGIALGDVTGVGPEVTLKALAADKDDAASYLVIGDQAVIDRTQRSLNLNLHFELWQGPQTRGRFLLHNPLPQPLPTKPKQGGAEAAQAALAFVADGTQRCLRGEIGALVTAPVNKEAIIRSGHSGFTGQTEYLAELSGTEHVIMMLLGQDERDRWLRVALVTTHLPLKAVSHAITQPKVELAIEMAARACRDLRLPRARVGVCGLNPHAGEGGKIGTEEIEIITPAVKAAAARGLEVSGPFAADTLFHYAYRGDYEAVVAMYHDQGLAPLKMIGFDRGINWTLGLPLIRTSPDHGTAYDIAGQGKANPSSMQAAIGLAKELVQRRALH